MKDIELQQFINETIQQILSGVALAKQRAQEKYNNCIVSPGSINGEKKPSEQMIEFEVAIKLATNASGGLAISVFNGNIDHSKEVWHKIKFSVPTLMRGLK